jgi:hypothetical protein
MEVLRAVPTPLPRGTGIRVVVDLAHEVYQDLGQTHASATQRFEPTAFL